MQLTDKGIHRGQLYSGSSTRKHRPAGSGIVTGGEHVAMPACKHSKHVYVKTLTCLLVSFRIPDMNDEPGSMQSQGGKARALKLTSAQLTAIAKKGAAARWDVPKATHEGEIKLNETISISCAVLEDGCTWLSADIRIRTSNQRSLNVPVFWAPPTLRRSFQTS
jgi:hypothetical protein